MQTDASSTPPTPATDAREAVARALCRDQIIRMGSHKAESAIAAFVEQHWRGHLLAADAALSALAPIRAAEILAARTSGRNDATKAYLEGVEHGEAAGEANERARIEADLKDPQIVHMNMLRGGIAKINVIQAMHLNGWTSIDNWHRMTVEQIEAAVKTRNEHGVGK